MPAEGWQGGWKGGEGVALILSVIILAPQTLLGRKFANNEGDISAVRPGSLSCHDFLL